jgi:hypothetical protein
MSIINGKTDRKIDVAEATSRMLEAVQDALDNPHGPQPSISDWAQVVQALVAAKR